MLSFLKEKIIPCNVVILRNFLEMLLYLAYTVYCEGGKNELRIIWKDLNAHSITKLTAQLANIA